MTTTYESFKQELTNWTKPFCQVTNKEKYIILKGFNVKFCCSFERYPLITVSDTYGYGAKRYFNNVKNVVDYFVSIHNVELFKHKQYFSNSMIRIFKCKELHSKEYYPSHEENSLLYSITFVFKESAKVWLQFRKRNTTHLTIQYDGSEYFIYDGNCVNLLGSSASSYDISPLIKSYLDSNKFECYYKL